MCEEQQWAGVEVKAALTLNKALGTGGGESTAAHLSGLILENRPHWVGFKDILDALGRRKISCLYWESNL